MELEPVDQDALCRLAQVGRLCPERNVSCQPSATKWTLWSSRHLALLALAAARGGALLNLGRVAVKDEDGPHAEEEQLGHAVEGADEVRVADHVALVVAHGLDELREPDARVHRQHLALQRLDLDLPPHGRQQHPQVLHAHARSGLPLSAFLALVAPAATNERAIRPPFPSNQRLASTIYSQSLASTRLKRRATSRLAMARVKPGDAIEFAAGPGRELVAARVVEVEGAECTVQLSPFEPLQRVQLDRTLYKASRMKSHSEQK